MRFRLPQQWQVLSQGKPGHRFQDRYHAHRRRRTKQGMLHRLGRILLAIIATAIGLVLVFIPGPAILFFFVAGALLAVDWLWLARLLDWLEVKLRAWWKRSVAWWRKLSLTARLSLLAFGGGLSVVTTYGAYRLMN
jgi:hypothetical protein